MIYTYRPFKLKKKNENYEYGFYTLVNNSTRRALSQLGVLDEPVSSKIKTHAEEPTKEILIDKLNFPNFPALASIRGPYRPITTEIGHDLNDDRNLIKVANKFTGSLLYMD